MSTLEEAIIFIVAFLFVLGVVGFAAEYVQAHRYDSKICWRIARWLDSL